MPLAELLGITIGSLGDGQVTCRLTITDEHLNQGLIGHGGVLFTLADTALGLAANPAGQEVTWAGIGFSLQLYRAVNVSDTVCASAVIEHQTRNLTVCRVEITREHDGRPIGAVTAQMLRLPATSSKAEGGRSVRLGDPETPLVRAMRAAYMREIVPAERRSRAITAVALIHVEAQPRGYATIVGSTPSGAIGELWIHPYWRGQGLGRALSEGTVALAHDLGFKELDPSGRPAADTTP
jgi:acyl-CoA thioesterase